MCLYYGSLANHTVPNFGDLYGNVMGPSRALCQHLQGLWMSQLKNVHTSSAKCGNTLRKRLVLGIETSCDDTGAAVVDEDGIVIGEAIDSQTQIHVESGGILPPVARDLHRQNIKRVVDAALENAGIRYQDVDAVATTVKPGLAMSLSVGLNYTKQLLIEYPKPFIPIHHMEAHALTARMIHSIDFPFLVLLASGGHCLLAVARSVEDFLLLGSSIDDAPGDAFDKTARSLRLKNLLECSGLSGGEAIELLAERGDLNAFPKTNVRLPNCNFSFAGIKSSMKQLIKTENEKYGLDPVSVLPTAADICASFQNSILSHMAKRVQRALLYCELNGLLPEHNKTLVMSGGVGSNKFIRRGLENLCRRYDCQLICPPPKLCTDNGIMIAWNGMEKLKLGIGVELHPETVQAQPKCPMGKDVSEEVARTEIKLKRYKLI